MTDGISVIVPVFDDAAYVGDAIESVLGQTLSPLEILVVDDGSTDGSAEVAASCGPEVRVLRRPHAGAGAARNHGVAMSRGDRLAFLDADDVWLPEKLALQDAALAADPSLAMVFAHLEHFHSPDLSPAMVRRFPCPPLPMPCTTAVAMLVRRDAFLRVGDFDESGELGEVIDWYARARALELPEATLSDTLVRRRIHAANTGVRRAADKSQYARIAKAALDRRRALANADKVKR